MVNHEIVTLAVFLVGGDVQHVDTEDVAKKANELAPGRFTWRKYKDQINIENVRAFCVDATKEKNGSYLLGAGKQGWMLTPEGLRFARQQAKELSTHDLSRNRLSKDELAVERWKDKERVRLLASTAFEKWTSGHVAEITLEDSHGFFRIDEYVVGATRATRIQRVMNVCIESNEQALVSLGEHLRLQMENGK